MGSLGRLYIADLSNHRIRMVDQNGIISTVAGTGAKGSTGDGGPAVNAQLSSPNNLALDSVGNLYISENHRVRKVEANSAGTYQCVITNASGSVTSNGAVLTTN